MLRAANQRNVGLSERSDFTSIISRVNKAIMPLRGDGLRCRELFRTNKRPTFPFLEGKVGVWERGSLLPLNHREVAVEPHLCARMNVYFGSMFSIAYRGFAADLGADDDMF